MSEVKRYYIGAYSGEAEARTCSPHALETVHQDEGRYFVLDEDFDRVTAERDAALADLASANSDKEAYAQNAIDLRKRVDALQQRLTAADERADVLEGLLRDVSGRGRVVNWELGLMDQIDDALKGFCSSCNGAGWANQGCVDLCTACAGSGMSQAKTAKADANE